MSGDVLVFNWTGKIENFLRTYSWITWKENEGKKKITLTYVFHRTKMLTDYRKFYLAILFGLKEACTGWEAGGGCTKKGNQ